VNDQEQHRPPPGPGEGGRWQAVWERFGATAEPAVAGPTEAADGTQPARYVEPAEHPQPTEHPEPTPVVRPEALPLPADDAVSADLTSADLTSDSLLIPSKQAPARGWRRLVHRASGGIVNPGPSAGDLHREHVARRIGTPIPGVHRVAVVSLKGGIGKTTTVACLGLTLADHRGDRVVAIDANPDAGTLAERLTGDVSATMHDLLAALPTIGSYTDITEFTSLAGRLQVVASGQDPETSHALDEQQYRAAATALQRYFNLVLTDSGTGLMHSAMAGTLGMADSLVVVAAPSVDGATRAAKTLDWLVAHGHGDLVHRSVAVISTVRPGTTRVDLAAVRRHLAHRCRAVVEIPYDPHLVAGGLIDLESLRGATRQAYVELAAAVADGFAVQR